MHLVKILAAIIFTAYGLSLPSFAAVVDTSDNAITANIQALFLKDPDLRGQNIKVSTQNGEVTLNGTVPSIVNSNAAVKDAKSVAGVKNVYSYIVSTTTDCQITTTVQKVISQNKLLKGLTIKVTTLNGVVTLSGVVETQAQIDAVISDVKAVDGVVAVDSELAATNIPKVK